MTCQATCNEWAESEQSLVNNTFICGSGANSTRKATLKRDLTSCTVSRDRGNDARRLRASSAIPRREADLLSSQDWNAEGSMAPSCVEGSTNEGNCGFQGSVTQLCAYCDPSASDGGVNACCLQANANTTSCGYVLTGADVRSSTSSATPTSTVPSLSPTNAADNSARSTSRLSGGGIAGAVVGSTIGALLLLLLLLFLCRRRRRAIAAQQGPRGIEGGMAERSPTLVGAAAAKSSIARSRTSSPEESPRAASPDPSVKPAAAQKVKHAPVEFIKEKDSTPAPAPPSYPQEKSADSKYPEEKSAPSHGPTNASV